MRPALIMRVLIFFALAEGILGLLFYLSGPVIFRILLSITMAGIFLLCLAGFLYAWFDR